MNEAYAKVYQNLQEFETRGSSSSSSIRQQKINALLASKNKANVGSGENVTVEKDKVTDRQSSAGSTSGGGGNSGGSAGGGGSTQKRSVSPLTQKRLDKQAAEAETNRQASEIEKKNPGALNRSFAGAIKNNNNNQSSGGSRCR